MAPQYSEPVAHVLHASRAVDHGVLAMRPGSNVSGLYFAPPEARYFGLGKIDREQVANYRVRKGMTVADGQTLAVAEPHYDPAG
jgi:hypothetical protein